MNEPINDLFGMREDKITTAINVIREHEPTDGYYVAFSGGKDSVVVIDLVRRAGVKYDAHYNITGIDPPELFYFIRDEYPDVVRHRPKQTMWALIKRKRMPPTRRIRYCCEYLKEDSGRNRVVVTGVRKAESTKRSKRKVFEKDTRNKATYFLNPIIDWGDHDVWDYIKTNNIPYCKLYDEGFKRLGCIGCPMAGRAGREKEFARWPAYERLYRKAFEIAAKGNIEMLGDRYANGGRWKDGDTMFDWWMETEHKKKDSNQGEMFKDEEK